ncbi:molybdopterin-dependent oxidoreductase [Pandoraea soli]|nr:molybdopterin-dependent oxidoreductase [Pandoraea soli]
MSLDSMRAPAGASPDIRPTDSVAPGASVNAVAVATVEPSAPASRVSREVVVSGCVKRRHSFDLCALMRLPTQLTGPLDVTCLSGRTVRSASEFKGVRLSALLDIAQLRLPQARDFTRACVLAQGADGYTVMFSWHELYNTPVGVGALVVYERDGRPLGDDDGGIGLISTCDRRVALRQVRSLARLSVQLVDPPMR